ncbi:MAG: DMT family transporter [bacterium]|nr:DMT family transporter [bacterium]
MQTRTRGILFAAIAMTAVGSGVTISDNLTAYPVFTAQAFRYGLATGVLAFGMRIAGRRIPRPRGTDWMWLVALAAAGLALFNVAVIEAVKNAEPAAVAVILSVVPLVLMSGEALRRRAVPRAGLIVGVLLVVLGAVVVQGAGRTSAVGILWSLVALVCEAAFTLLAVPVLPRLGAHGVSVHCCWIATLQLAVLAVVVDGPDAVVAPDGAEIFAIGYLAVILTAFAFVAWYRAVECLALGTAGLFAGLVPISAALTGLVVGLTTVTLAVLGGSVLVGAGIVVGVSCDREVEPAESVVVEGQNLIHLRR